jgi:hypothetical protein
LPALVDHELMFTDVGHHRVTLPTAH